MSRPMPSPMPPSPPPSLHPQVSETDQSDTYEVCGRGQLHLTVLIENMRREGFELMIGPPTVIEKKVDGQICEPFDQVRPLLPLCLSLFVSYIYMYILLFAFIALVVPPYSHLHPIHPLPPSLTSPHIRTHPLPPQVDVTVPNEYTSAVVDLLNKRKGEMASMGPAEGSEAQTQLQVGVVWGWDGSGWGWRLFAFSRMSC